MEIRENKVHIVARRFILDAVLICDVDDPGFAVDQEEILAWTHAHGEMLAKEPYDNICRVVASEFPRVVTVEVTDPENGSGVILHPWTGA